MTTIRDVERRFMKAEVPGDFRVGDSVEVSLRIKEGDKERVQVFSGTVIARRGGGIRSTVTVRRIVSGEGVELTVPLHSPKVAGIKSVRRGKVRRAKLYYLRDRVGKATRIKEDLKAVAEHRKKEKARKKKERAAESAAAAAAKEREKEAEGSAELSTEAAKA